MEQPITGKTVSGNTVTVTTYQMEVTNPVGERIVLYDAANVRHIVRDGDSVHVYLSTQPAPAALTFASIEEAAIFERRVNDLRRSTMPERAETQVITYPNPDAYNRDAAQRTAAGWRVTNSMERTRNAGCLGIFLTFGLRLIFKPKPQIVVTYQRTSH